MSAYPPPPPPPPPSSGQPLGSAPGSTPNSGSGAGGYPPPDSGPSAGPGYGYAPNFDPRAWKAQAKAQQRMMRAQVRMQRDQAKAQWRAARRYSVVGPLFLLLIGTIFLLLETGRLSWGRAMEWYGHWWPLLLIGAGLLMLAEWAMNGRRGALLGGGMVTLLIFLGIVGWTSGEVHRHLGWTGDNFAGWTPFLGDAHEEDGSPLNTAVAATGTLLIHNPRGDVNVTGASDDGQVHVTVHKEIHAFGDSETASRSRQLQPEFSGAADALQLSVPQVDGSHADLQVSVPRGVTVTVDAEHGAVSVAEMHAPVSVSAGQGEVSLSGITGPVTAHLHSRNGSLSAHSVTGGVQVDGRGGDVNLSDVAGPVALQGEFYGTTHMEHVNGSVSFETFRTVFKASRLDGELQISSGSGDAPLQGEAILGPVVLHTSDRVITLDRVQGNVDIDDSRGSVSLTSAGPLGTISVHDRNGSVYVGIPAEASFTLDAQTHDGHIENDFGLKAADNDDRPTLTGTVGHGGPAVTLRTDDGDVTLRKSSAAALPATAPAASTISEGAAEPSPSAASPPKAPKATKHKTP